MLCAIANTASFLLPPSSYVRQTGHIEINGVEDSTLSAVEFTGLVGFVPQVNNLLVPLNTLLNTLLTPLNDLYTPLTVLSGLCVGFVPQEDIMMRMLTVKENLTLSAMLRLPAHWSNIRKRQFVGATLDILGLHSIRHSIIGDETERGISGGQRKRVNIGLEMVADPTVLFLDEPTSGLDSTSSMEVCDALGKIASLGVTVVTVIHQPRYEIFTAFDDVLLLGKGGRTVYLGPSDDALEYVKRS